MIFTRLHCLISSRKFYQVALENAKHTLPTTPAQGIISKHLSAGRAAPPSSRPNRTQQSTSRYVDYGRLFREQPNGSIIEREYKGTSLMLTSLSYSSIELTQLHQLCSEYRPDLVVVQARPEMHLPHFVLLPKAIDDDVFSEKEYLEQLTLRPEESRKYLLSADIISKFRSMIDPLGSAAPEGPVTIPTHRQLLQDQIPLLLAHYSAENKVPLLLSDLPQQPHRETVCNTHTLMELQELFKGVAKALPMQSQLPPFRLAALAHPQLFLSPRDHYQATLLEMLIATGRYKRIMAVMGMGENEAVWDIMDRELIVEAESGSFVPLIEHLIAPPVKPSLLRPTVEGWEVIEKHVLMDVLQHGAATGRLPFRYFTTTERVAQCYGSQLNQYPSDTILTFRRDKAMKYMQLMENVGREGAQLRQKYMLREAIRGQDEDEAGAWVRE